MNDKKELMTLPEGTQVVPNTLDGRPMPTNTLELKLFIKQEVASQTKDILAALEKQIRLQMGVR